MCSSDLPVSPAYPDLRGKVAELEQSLKSAQAAAPKYPDLSGKVSELEKALKAAQSAEPKYPDRKQWAYDLAYAQWTPEEMAKGSAWRNLFR